MSQRDFLRHMFKYNQWANSRYRTVLRSVERPGLELKTEYGDLLERIVHIFASYGMWLKRLRNEPPKSAITSTDFETWGEIETKWTEMDELLISYVDEVDENQLEETVSYTSLDGRSFTRRRIDILFHLIQHPTYHRGQLSSIFKHNDNLPNFPATDVVVYLTAPDRDSN